MENEVLKNLDDMLKQFKFMDYPFNKSLLTSFLEKLTKELTENSQQTNLFVENLYKPKLDEDWFLAQCRSACNQIKKILDNDSTFHQYYDSVLVEADLLLLSKELILDVHLLNKISKNRLKLDGSSCRDHYVPSIQFFLHAKFSCFTNKNIIETTNRNFLFSSMPTLIRQAIEIKMSGMIGLEGVTNTNGGFKLVGISKILDFFNDEGKNFLNLPLPIATLTAINSWTNGFTHTGVTTFCWQSLEAIDLIEPLFEIKDKESRACCINGFSYIAEGISLETIKDALDKKFDATFNLNIRSIEGSRKYKEASS